MRKVGKAPLEEDGVNKRSVGGEERSWSVTERQDSHSVCCLSSRLLRRSPCVCLCSAGGCGLQAVAPPRRVPDGLPSATHVCLQKAMKCQDFCSQSVVSSRCRPLVKAP